MYLVVVYNYVYAMYVCLVILLLSNPLSCVLEIVCICGVQQ
jgi:hypothetical protein